VSAPEPVPGARAAHPPKPKQLDSPLLPRIFRLGARVNTWTYRRTGGRVGGTFRLGAGFRKPAPTLLLDHVGRRSGRRFTVPLIYLERGADLVVVGSQGGRADHPQWYLNLLEHPDTTVQVGRETRAVTARTADAAERADLWPALCGVYADFDTYQSWAADREIPVVVLSPRS
jgi:deazaflavin-dependent oxidoreductase (nitroreductase family)